MRLGVLQSLFCALVLSPPLLQGEVDWSELTLGMTAEETISTLGPPMIRCRGRGFERWTYDDGAEVLFYGTLVGWTSPGSGPATGRSLDVWSENRSGTCFPTFLALLPQREPPAAPRTPAVRPAANPGGQIWLPAHVYRGR
jgi:hypothetical protein